MARTHALRIKGDEAVLNRPKVALFCSVKCPGKLILDTYDIAISFRTESDRPSKDWKRGVVPFPSGGTHFPLPRGGSR